VTAYGIYPLNRYSRLELSTGFLQFNQRYNDSGLQQLADFYQQENYGRSLFADGQFMPIGLSFVQETTVFREYGPLAGNTVRLAYEYAPSWGDMLSRQTAEVDARYYMRLATNGVLAFRARGFKSWGEFPGYLYFGGNSELRGYDYLEFLGNKAFFTNAELRFPIIEAALTPIGVVGGLRGVFFANFGASGYEGLPMKVWTSKPVSYIPLLGYEPDPTSIIGIKPVYGPEQQIGGFKLVDGRASYGIGLETFALGFPIHFDWSWRTLFNREWEDYVFAYQGFIDGTSGSKWFRKPKFSIWIGYDF
jgi:outer membrane protein assembly factor BamA